MNKYEIAQDVQKRLFEMRDEEYRQFHAKLMPTVDKERIIGVRTPALRKFAKEYAKTAEAGEFLRLLPHAYYEEDNLHGFLIEGMKDYEDCVCALDAFLPYVDNWATCDMMAPKIFGRHLSRLEGKIQEWMAAEHVYMIRFGIGMLMRFYLDENFKPEYLSRVAAVATEEYYIKMMVAWYFATALAKQYEATLPYIEEKRLEPWTHNKAIQKAVESRRITKEQKEYLRTWKIRRLGRDGER